MTAPTATRRARVGLGPALLTGALAAALAVIVNLAISAVARGPLGARDDFVPLTPAPVVMWTVIGTLAGAIGWRLVVNRSARGRALLAALVPAVLLLSLVPDVALLVTDATPGRTTAGVLALMLMHVATAAVAVAACRRTMPPG